MKRFLIVFGLISTGLVFGQEKPTTDFLSEIQKFDISYLWTLTNFQPENDTSFVKRQEPLGYIGDNYQRFYIHFISAIQNPSNNLEYFVYGKRMVKENICSFQGLITVTESRIYSEGDMPPFKQGFVKGNYKFFEDSKEKETGILSGNFETDFNIDKNGKMKYDALMFISDEFENNQFEGTWTSYKTNDSKKCNWGDYRIPDSKELDSGAAEFMVDDHYKLNGWETYLTAGGIIVGNLSIEEARKKEIEKWWIDSE